MNVLVSTFGRLRYVALFNMLIGFSILAYSVTQLGQSLWPSYFYAFIVWGGLTLGFLGLTLLVHTVRAKWGVPIIRILESGGGPLNLVLVGVLFLPIALMKSEIYPWMDPKLRDTDPILIHKAGYLSSCGFDLRAVIYFAFWIVLAYLLKKSTLRQDQTKDEKEYAYRANIGAPGLLFFVVTANFAMTDWVMSLQYQWFSTIFGIWMIIGMVLMAMAVVNIIIGKFLAKSFKDVYTPALTKDTGNLMFVLTMLWGYTSLSQFLIIWSGNLPEFISYYYYRNQGFWQILGGVNIVGQFFVPFLILLAPRAKAVPTLLFLTAVWVYVFRFSDLFWQIIPMFRKTGFQLSDFGALLGVGGLWFSVFSTQFQKSNIIPNYLPKTKEAH